MHTHEMAQELNAMYDSKLQITMRRIKRLLLHKQQTFTRVLQYTISFSLLQLFKNRKRIQFSSLH